MRDGYLSKELESLKVTRLKSWVVFRGYADPKKSPKSMEEWWPLEGEPVKRRRRANKKKLLEAIRIGKGE